MKPGISTACFYPIETEKALKEAVDYGVPYIEIFLNTVSETEESYIKRLKGILKNSEVVSVHPFTSEMETNFFFSTYKRRFEDGLKIYSRFFKICNELSAEYLVFHGVFKQAPISDEESLERLCKLAETASGFGVELLQENVARCKSGNINFIKKIKENTDVGFVLDIKQCIRAGVSPFDMAKAMGNKIKHLHVSDSDLKNDCKLPFDGNFEFNKFAVLLNRLNFNGAAIVEVYQNSYKNITQLLNAYSTLKRNLESYENRE